MHPYRKGKRGKSENGRGQKSKHKRKVHVYTDGSIKDGFGGWGVYIQDGVFEEVLSGAEWDTTIGAMEIRAVQEAIIRLDGCTIPIVVYIDSQYVVNALTMWWKKWERNGWHTTAGKPVKHVGMLRDILKRIEDRPVAFKWVKGHSGVEGNEAADKLAGSARKDLQVIRTYEEVVMSSDETSHSQWRFIAQRYRDGLGDVLTDMRGWASKHPIMVWNYYLILSYMYYEQDVSIVQDSDYDKLCKHLASLGKQECKERGAWWVDKFWDDSAMSSGSGFHLHGKLPVGIQNIGELLYQEVGYRTLTAREASGVAAPRKRKRMVKKRRTRRRMSLRKGG